MADVDTETQAVDLGAEQSTLVEETLRLRQTADADPKAKRELGKLSAKLDALYWKRVVQLAAEGAAEGRDTLSFSERERLLIDFGLLDEALIEGADDAFYESLYNEMETRGAINHYYFSEWLEDQYRRRRLAAQMEAQAEIREARENSELARLLDSRGKILRSLEPAFTGLPGVSSEIAHHILSGGLDDQIQMMGLLLLEEPKRAGFVRRFRLRQLRLSTLAKARARLAEEREFKLMDLLDGIYAKTWSERYAAYERDGLASLGEGNLEAMAASAAVAKMTEFLEGEIKLVKSLLPLGALAGGIPRPCSVMLRRGERITKAQTHEEIERARECDRDFTADPVVLIAPFTGRGFFEWDHDSLVVPLTPVEGAVDAIANATANYRMLIDSFQQEGRLKADYEAAFAGARFQQAFQADYRAWVCTAGRGRAEGMDPEHKRFFLERIGPEVRGVLGPSNLRHLGPDARQALKKRLEKQAALAPGDANLLYRLGILHWQEGGIDAALRAFAKAITLEPSNGMATFSLGLLLSGKGEKERAQRAFRVCRERVPETIWAVYAGLALEGGLPA